MYQSSMVIAPSNEWLPRSFLCKFLKKITFVYPLIVKAIGYSNMGM
jgi:hypothetical protein